jgi:hypothetical protein
LKVSLLVINALLPFIAIITLDNVATGPQRRPFFPKSLNPKLNNIFFFHKFKIPAGLEFTLVTFNSLASIILVAM